MKSLRRLRDRVAPSAGGTAAAPGEAADAVDPADTVPGGAVVATYAAALDGRHLWVAVDDRPGRLVLRDTATGRVLAAGADRPGGDRPGHLAAVLPLDEVVVGADHDVAVATPDPTALLPVWVARLSTTATPSAPDGRSRVVLRRAADGTLRVRRETLPAAALLRTVSVSPEGVELRLDDPAAALALVVEGGAEDVDAEPVVVAEPHDGVLLLTAGPLHELAAGTVRVVAVTGTDVRPVRRRDDDLAEPGRAVPLPELRDATTDLPRLRLRWDAEGHLAARLVDGEEDA